MLTAEVRGDKGEKLKPGGVGAAIHIHPGEEAFVAEFASLHGETVAIADCAAVTGASRNQRRRPKAQVTKARTAGLGRSRTRANGPGSSLARLAPPANWSAIPSPKP